MTDALPESAVLPRSSYIHPAKFGRMFLKRLRAEGAKIGRHTKRGKRGVKGIVSMKGKK